MTLHPRIRLTNDEIIHRLRAKVRSRFHESFDYLVDYARRHDRGVYLRKTLRLIRLICKKDVNCLASAAYELRNFPEGEAREYFDFHSFAFEYCDDDGFGVLLPYRLVCRQVLCGYLNDQYIDGNEYPAWLLKIALTLFHREYTVDDYHGWHHLAV